MSEWVESSLNQLVTFQKGRKVEISTYAQPGYDNYLGASGIEGSSDGYATTRFAVTAKPTDLLMLWDGERSGLVGYGRQGVVASTVSKLTPNQVIIPGYLYYALTRSFDWIQNRRTGTGVPHVPKDLGRILRLSFPKNLHEQQKIAAILTSIDTEIEKTEALIEKFKQIKAGLMHDLFTCGVLPNGQLRPPRDQAPELYQKTAIGWIPSCWTISPLNSKVNPARPIAYGILMPGYGYPGGVPVVKVKDIRERAIDIDGLLLTSPVIDHEYRRSRLRAGDILFTIRGTVGRVAMVPAQLDGANITQDTARIDLVGVDNEFASLYFETPRARRFFENNTLGVAVQGINLGELRKLPLPIPPFDEQLRITERLTEAIQRIAVESANRDKLSQQKLGLMQDLLTGKVPVPN